jgi:hypothetical protein
MAPTPDRIVAALAAEQHGLLTRRHARALGVSRARIASWIRAGVVDEPWPGVLRLTAVAPTWRQALLAVTLVRPGVAVASHRAAAALHGLDGFDADELELSVALPHRLALAGVVIHHVAAVEPRDVVSVDSIPTTGLARTLVDLGAVVGADRVERALDDARRRGTSLRWLRDTATRLHRPGQAGTKTLLVLLEQIDGDVRGSWFEKLVEECLRSPHLPPLVRQHRVRDERGRIAGILDVAFPAIRLGVEAHSRQFHFGRVAERRDEDRDHRVARLGWEVLYVGWQGAKRPDELLALVLEVARHRPLHPEL